MSLGPTEHARLANLPDDPWELFADLYARAVATAEIQYPGAMCLSTVGADGRPQGRFVIAHPRPGDGFVFLTDRRSPKARALAATPTAALTAYWSRPLELQIRVEGAVVEAPAAIADEIFARRPERSRRTPWVSRQSEAVTLDELAAGLDRLAGDPPSASAAGGLSRPAHWVGYRLVPASFEFWAARAGRLHDRFLYRAEGADWSRIRLAP